MADEYVPVRQNSTLDFDNFGGATAGRTFHTGNHPNSVVTQEGMTIVIMKGNICDQMVDCLANSIGGSFNLSEGAIAKSILQRAGPKIQEELTNVKPNQPRYGDIVTTKGYGLNASFVFHGVLKRWNQGRDDAEQILRVFVKNILVAANKRKLKKVAFPAVGCGGLSFPADVVAKCMFEECDNFSSQNSSTSIMEVRFVIYDKDTATFNAFEALTSRMQQGAGLGQAGAASYPVGLNDSDDEEDSSDDDNNDDDNDDDESPANLIFKLINGLQLQAKKKEPEMKRLGIECPSKWGPPDPADPYHRVTLKPSDAEYRAVEQNVRATAGSCVKQFIKIERIENHNLWKLYMMTQENMIKVNGPRVQNERLLWHGTAIDALDNIYAGGFNRSYCGKNATAYGKGVYFAKDFSYSAQPTYSPADGSGHKYVFQCRVLTGQFAVGNPTMIEPPVRSGKLRYDSITNDVTNPILWVVFKDTHAYPEYLVTFK